MKKLLLACAAGLAVVATVAPMPTEAKVATPYPIEYWAAPDFMRNVEVSPDGKYVAFVKAESQKGDNIIEIYETADMKKKPVRVGAKSMDLQGFSWIGDSEMVVAFDKQVSKRIKGFNRGARKGKLALYSMDTKKFKELTGDEFGVSLANILPNEPDHVLARFTTFEKNRASTSDFYRYNLRTGQKSLVLKGSRGRGEERFDEDGNPRFAAEFNPGSGEYIWFYRPVGGSGWTEYHRMSEDSFEEFRFAGRVEGDDSRIYVIAHNGQDKTALWKFNLETKSFEDKVFSHPEVDVVTTVSHSNSWTKPGVVTGAVYGTDKYHIEFMDREEEAIIRQFQKSVPNAHRLTVTSRSRDGNVLVLRNSGPKDPGTFYLYNNGKFSQLGSVNGLLKGDKLADVEYIKYTARDGRTIPAYVTVPNGPGPHPLVVLPHGGPFLTEVVEYDPWGQMLANNGYMVIQPQYRGSTNYGLEHYKAAFINGGEGGKKMQDDKDDGALHLIKQGKVDPNRVAMFGWSYGGYSALIAGQREDNIYNCVIAGAAVADMTQQVNYYKNRLRGSQKVAQLAYRQDSVNPIDTVDKVNVPMLVVHGSIDQRVPLKHADRYMSAVKKAGKDVKYLELKDADHFLNTLDYDHKMDFYPAIISFLQNECKMPT